MNKKGFGFDLAKDLLILAVVTAFLIVLATQTLDAVDSQSKVGICGVSAVVTDLSGQLSQASVKPKWRCPIDGPIEITYDDLNSNPASWLPRQTRATYSEQDSFDMELVAKDTSERAQYNLNKIVAGKVKDCYLKTGFSRAELFSNWYDFLGMEEGKEQNFLDIMNPTNYKFKYPVGCGICSTLYLDEKALDFVDTHVMDDLEEYMYSHPQSPTSTESLLDFTELRGDGIFLPDLTYTVGGISDPMYVVIQRHEIHQALKWFDQASGAVTWGLKTVSGAQITEKTAPEAYVAIRVLKGSDLNRECAFIANEFEEE